jgi:adenylate cyclase
LSQVYLLIRKYEKAIASGKRSVELQPNGAIFHANLGSTLSYAGRVDEAISHINKAIRLNPFPPYYYYQYLARCYLQKGQYGDALAGYRKALHRAPDAPGNHLSIAITYALLDREEEARASAAKALELNPMFSVSWYSKISKHKDQAFTKHVVDAMRKAGFPE